MAKSQGLKCLPSNILGMLKKSSSLEQLSQFQPNLVGNMLGDGDSVFSNKGAGHFWGPIRGKIRKL